MLCKLDPYLYSLAFRLVGYHGLSGDLQDLFMQIARFEVLIIITNRNVNLRKKILVIFIHCRVRLLLDISSSRPYNC